MSCTLITHRDCLGHEMQPGHPESPARLASVLQHLDATGIVGNLTVLDAPLAETASLAAAHSQAYVRAITDAAPTEGLVALDPDTLMCPASLTAALRAAGAVIEGVRSIIRGDAARVFCAVRPPGHHAEESQAMGFCLFNNVAAGALEALAGGIGRVAILDFDVHHGNGTVDIFKDRPEVLVCSTFQHPHYPNRLFDVDRPNIVNTPLPAGTNGNAFRAAVERDWLPAIDTHEPELVLVSAGFDAHAADPLGGLELLEADFTWVTQLIRSMANDHAEGRIVSTLEGGYNLAALARSVEAHISALM